MEHRTAPVVLRVALLVILCTFSKGHIPEDDFRIINRQDLLASDSDIFVDNSTESFSQLLFDVARDQLVVGARDALYRLSLRGLRLLESAAWPAPPDKTKLCQVKGQTERDCHNYIKILLAHENKLFACGTNAFSPKCSWREIEAVGSVLEWVHGVAKCPHNPQSNVTAILTTSGEYYVGTPTDFAGSDTAVYRSRGASSSDSVTLRTPQYDPSWLNEPQFVGSFEDDLFVYFVFREVAVEFMNCGKIIYSRIGRVCKNDSGGHLVLKDNWSTFLKARLNCSLPGDFPFYYDLVQSISYMANEKLLLATFTTPTNSIAGSAVCAYNMSDIHAAFEGPFKVQNSPSNAWEPRVQTPFARRHFRCQGDARSHQSVEYHRYQLMHDSIQPISGKPIYKSILERFTYITSDVTATKNTPQQFVMFVATEESVVMKLAVLPRFGGACLIELWRLNDEKKMFTIQSMQFVEDTTSIYLGGAEGVLRLGVHRCHRYGTRAACVGAADPYCGWQDGRDRCVDTVHLQPQLTQSSDYCPVLDMPVDGSWSSWSEWNPCIQDNEGYIGTDKPDMCMCRVRQCNNPKPANGGKSCTGASVAVSRCTVHGGWSTWSSWSACSTSCGIAVKTRRRSCTAPAPQHGGRLCVGQDSQEIYCTNLPPCPDPGLAAVDGSWSPWGAWSACSAEGPACGAGAGWRERRRTCTNPPPKHGGADCEGERSERQSCDLRACDVRKATAWTPWVQIPGNTSDGSYTEKRFKFICKSQTPEQIKLSIAKEEDRYCTARGSCGSTPLEEESTGWGPWGPWGACSASCGGGQQLRSRECRQQACVGSTDMLRPCNAHACTGEWSCWSEWSECTGGCSADSTPATGQRQRTRGCLSPEGCADAGAAIEKRTCLSSCGGITDSPLCRGCMEEVETPVHVLLKCRSMANQRARIRGLPRSLSEVCGNVYGILDFWDELGDEQAGWGAWSEWGDCVNGERVRRRVCERGACTGPIIQVALCDDMDNELNALPAYSHSIEMASFVTLSDNASLGVGSIAGCIIAAFVIGCLITFGVGMYCSRRQGLSPLPWSRKTKVPSSPHYITAKQNSYVTVPLKDVPRKAKRQPSFSGICSTSGGLILSKSNNLSSNNTNNHNNTLTTPKLYPKAIANEYDSLGTLKRHSANQANNKNNVDLDEEKFY